MGGAGCEGQAGLYATFAYRRGRCGGDVADQSGDQSTPAGTAGRDRSRARPSPQRAAGRARPALAHARPWAGVRGGQDRQRRTRQPGAGTPRIQAHHMLFEAETPAPVALIDGIALTNIRIAAASTAAADYLAPRKASRGW
ncbi:hypothetical protein [Streptomyces humicola]|uniref:hypothetical protein n=1 Tax=Streptomyces humicola TaxID=2953240 RepID=UPI0027E39FCC|nr:hypothetical protein [Streptomyces humicola]